MHDFPQELFIALLFGAVLLGQFLYKQLRRRALLMQAQNAPEAATRATAVPLARTRTPEPAGPVEAPTLLPNAAPPARHRPRRFSRQGLLPDQRALQDAFVIATILGPCHAQRPHEFE